MEFRDKRVREYVLMLKSYPVSLVEVGKCLEGERVSHARVGLIHCREAIFQVVGVIDLKDNAEGSVAGAGCNAAPRAHGRCNVVDATDRGSKDARVVVKIVRAVCSKRGKVGKTVRRRAASGGRVYYLERPQ